MYPKIPRCVHWEKLINFTATVSKDSAKREEMKKNLWSAAPEGEDEIEGSWCLNHAWQGSLPPFLAISCPYSCC